MGPLGCLTYLQRHQDHLSAWITLQRSPLCVNPPAASSNGSALPGRCRGGAPHLPQHVVLIDGMGVLLGILSRSYDSVGCRLAPKLLGGDLQRVALKLAQFARTFYEFGIRLVFLLDGYHTSGVDGVEDEDALTAQLDAQRRKLREGRMMDRLDRDRQAVIALSNATALNEADPGLLRRVAADVVPDGLLDEAVLALRGPLREQYLTEVLQLTDEVDKDVEALCQRYHPLFVLSNDADMALYPRIPAFVMFQSTEMRTLCDAILFEKEIPPVLQLRAHTHDRLKSFTGLDSRALAYCAALTGNDVTKEFFHSFFEDVVQQWLRSGDDGTRLRMSLPSAAQPFVEAAVARYLSFSQLSTAAQMEQSKKVQLVDPSFPRHLLTLKLYGAYRCGIGIYCCEASLPSQNSWSTTPTHKNTNKGKRRAALGSTSLAPCDPMEHPNATNSSHIEASPPNLNALELARSDTGANNAALEELSGVVLFFRMGEIPVYTHLVRACATLVGRNYFFLQLPPTHRLGVASDIAVQGLELEGLSAEVNWVQVDWSSKKKILHALYQLRGVPEDVVEHIAPQECFVLCVLQCVASQLKGFRSLVQAACLAVSLSISLRMEPSSELGKKPEGGGKLEQAYAYWVRQLPETEDLRLLMVSDSIRSFARLTADLFTLLHVWDALKDRTIWHPACLFRGSALRVCWSFRETVRRQKPFAEVYHRAALWSRFVLRGVE